jgi:DNA-binding protein Fis
MEFFDDTKNEYTFFVKTYFEEFKKAVENYITDLENGQESNALLETALENRPELL